MKLSLRRASILAVVLALSACTTVVKERVVVHDQGPPVIRNAPPPIHEVIVAQPAPNYNWVPGHWVWVGSGWNWQAGHWYQGYVRPMPPVIVEQITVAPSPAHFWVPGHWHWRERDWVWEHGHWSH